VPVIYLKKQETENKKTETLQQEYIKKINKAGH
jgi:hypothetical protein